MDNIIYKSQNVKFIGYKDGDSPYKIDISNDSIRFILPYGELLDKQTKEVSIKLFKGIEEIPNPNFNCVSSAGSNITLEKKKNTASTYIITILPETDNQRYNNIETLTITSQGVSSSITIEKLFNGEQGDSAEEWYVVPNATSIKRYFDYETGEEYYDPESISVDFYKKVGNGLPQQINSGFFGYSALKNATNDNINELSEEGISSEDLQNDKTVYFYYKATKASDWVLWDWETFETLEDGAPGEPGEPGAGQKEILECYVAKKVNHGDGDNILLEELKISKENDFGEYKISSLDFDFEETVYSQDLFFGSYETNGIWDIRNPELNGQENPSYVHPKDFPYVFKITLVYTTDEQYYAISKFTKVSDIDLIEIAAEIQTAGESGDFASSKGRWANIAGKTAID